MDNVDRPNRPAATTAQPAPDGAALRRSNTRPKRILAIASAGGHWVQLLRLAPAWDGCDVAYMSTDAGLAQWVETDADTRRQRRPRFYRVSEANRNEKFRLIVSALQIAWVVLRERPAVVVTTGAAPGFLALWMGRRIGARTIWIDSIANSEELSMSGAMAQRHADLFLTQWPHLTKEGGPEYWGAVL